MRGEVCSLPARCACLYRSAAGWFRNRYLASPHSSRSPYSPAQHSACSMIYLQIDVHARSYQNSVSLACGYCDHELISRTWVYVLRFTSLYRSVHTCDLHAAVRTDPLCTNVVIAWSFRRILASTANWGPATANFAHCVVFSVCHLCNEGDDWAHLISLYCSSVPHRSSCSNRPPESQSFQQWYVVFTLHQTSRIVWWRLLVL